MILGCRFSTYPMMYFFPPIRWVTKTLHPLAPASAPPIQIFEPTVACLSKSYPIFGFGPYVCRYLCGQCVQVVTSKCKNSNLALQPRRGRLIEPRPRSRGLLKAEETQLPPVLFSLHCSSSSSLLRLLAFFVLCHRRPPSAAE